jgi:hypothetical protein
MPQMNRCSDADRVRLRRLSVVIFSVVACALVGPGVPSSAEASGVYVQVRGESPQEARDFLRRIIKQNVGEFRLTRTEFMSPPKGGPLASVELEYAARDGSEVTLQMHRYSSRQAAQRKVKAVARALAEKDFVLRRSKQVSTPSGESLGVMMLLESPQGLQVIAWNNGRLVLVAVGHKKVERLYDALPY